MFNETQNLTFHNPEKMSKSEIIKAINSKDKNIVCNALLASAFYEKELNFSINLIQTTLLHECHDIRSLSILCIAHLARIHKQLPEEIVIPIIITALKSNNFDIKDRGNIVMEDLQIFIPSLWKKITKLIKSTNK